MPNSGGVRSALVTQLKLEGWISVIKDGSASVLKVQPALEEVA